MPTSYIDDPDDIKLNSQDEVNQILGRPPGSLLRYGMLCLWLFFGIMAALSFLIKYPDKIPARVQLLTQNPAIKVVARVDGKLNKLLVSNNQQVTKGTLLGILDNPAETADVNRLNDFVEELETRIHQGGQFTGISLPENLKLGNLQFKYAALTQKINDYLYFRGSDDVRQKISSLEKQIQLKEELGYNLKKQKTILLQEIELLQANLDRNKDLYKEDGIALIELETLKAQVLQQQRQLDRLDQEMLSNDISKESLRTSIIDLRQSQKDGFSGRRLTIEEDLESIRSDIATWKQQYLLLAPIDGRISFSNIFSEQQFVEANEEVLTIVPDSDKGKMVARALLPISNSGKVQPGQRVNIQLDGFPFTEFGIVIGKVEQISLVPLSSSDQSEGHYLVDIQLPDTLRTTYNKEIPFRQEMQGTANIVTDDRRVMVRILDRVLSALRNQ
jgi:multidrug resistance efflux pump